MDAKMIFPWIRWMSRLNNRKHRSQTKMVPHFQRRNKKIYYLSEQIYTSFTNVATLLGENVRTVGFKLSRSIAFEMLIQGKSKMVIQESAQKLYLALCEVEGLTEDEHYRALSKILGYPT
ncbi:hypothetical protein Gotri_015932 [Gossypium trilobum]|uniref:Uncharacterized protein n=1 Tax=Gossypium trilobum TaxID=34281 RepID=A0A7J9E2F9_9ROSI|nr:hypothetical protein [Gossypium trilobum]